jgi:hypothetical protein
MPYSRLRYVRQAHPTIAELAALPANPAGDDGVVTVSTGPWADQRRCYHLCFDIDPEDRNTERDTRVARVDLQVWQDGQLTAAPGAEPAVVLAYWTAEVLRTGEANATLASVLGHEELLAATRAAGNAYRAGDLERAAREWGRAVKLATRLGNEEALARLALLVEIRDGECGEVRIRESVREIDLKRSEINRTTTLYHPTGGPVDRTSGVAAGGT